MQGGLYMFCCFTKKSTRRVLSAIAFMAVLLVAISLMMQDNPKAVTTASYEWGLSFQTKNAPPVPNLSAEKLRPYDAFYFSGKPEKRLYITFDAGFENGNMPTILDALKKHNVKAAFFLVVPYIKENPDLVKRMVDEGHIVGNHTNHHPNMTKKDKASFEKELTDVEETFAQVTGKTLPKFFRPPEGKFTDENLQWAKDLGYKTIFWSIAYRDWYQDNQPSHDEAFGKLIPRTHDGAIVLLHSTSKTNATILDELLSKWEELGYTFGTLDELG